MTIDGAHCVALSNPSAPSRAVSTRNPQEDTSSASPDRSFSSSSTINIFSWFICLFLTSSFAQSTAPIRIEADVPCDRVSTIRGSFLHGKVSTGICRLDP